MLTEQADCAICGKEFTRECKTGRRVRFCSEECRNRSRKNASNKYNQKRYSEDPEWRAHKRALNASSEKKRRLANKEKALQEVVDEVMAANSREEVEKVLREKVRVKSKYYN